MTLVIFGVGLGVFFLTIFGTVMAGGVRLTKNQLTASPELDPDLAETVDARDSA